MVISPKGKRLAEAGATGRQCRRTGGRRGVAGERPARSAILNYLGLRGDLILLFGMVVFVGLGERIGSRYIPKYIQVLGGSALIIGLYGAMENLLGALWALPGGILSDRLGTKRALAIFNLIAMVGYAIVVIVPSWPAVLVAAVFFLAWSSLSLPATMSLVVQVLPKTKRAMGVSMHSLIRRFPMAIGPVIGGALIAALGVERGVRVAFGIALVLALLALVLQQRMVSAEPKKYDPIHPLQLLRRFDPALRRLLVSDILIRFCEQIPYAFVVLWVMDVVRKPATEFGWLSAVEMATAALIYIPVAHFSDKTERKPFVVVTFCFFTLFPVALYFSRGHGGPDRRLHPARIEGVRGADTEGADRRSLGRRPRGAHRGHVLSDARLDREHRRIHGRRSVEDRSRLEPRRGLRLRRDRNAYFALFGRGTEMGQREASARAS